MCSAVPPNDIIPAVPSVEVVVLEAVELGSGVSVYTSLRCDVSLSSQGSSLRCSTVESTASAPLTKDSAVWYNSPAETSDVCSAPQACRIALTVDRASYRPPATLHISVMGADATAVGLVATASLPLTWFEANVSAGKRVWLDLLDNRMALAGRVRVWIAFHPSGIPKR